jgi:hypothetical protein
MTRQSVLSKPYTVNLANMPTGGEFPTEALSAGSFSHLYEFVASINISLTPVGHAAGAKVYRSLRDRSCPRECYSSRSRNHAWTDLASGERRL